MCEAAGGSATSGTHKRFPDPVGGVAGSRHRTRVIFDGAAKGQKDLFPDPMSESMAESWRSGAAQALERQYAALVAAEPVN
jgi:hypothetical protein